MLVVAASGMAGLVAWLLVGGAAPEAQTSVTSVVAPIMDLVAVVLVLHAAYVAQPGRIRTAWALLGASMLAYALGDALWAFITLVQGQDALASGADVAYIAFYPLVGAALLLFPSPSVARREAYRLAIDLGIVALGGGMVVWHTLLRPLITAPDLDPLGQALALAYPIGDLALLVSVATIALRRPLGIDQRALLALVTGLGLMFAADMVYGDLALSDAPYSAWVDVMYLGSSLSIAAAGYIQARSVGSSTVENRAPVSRLLVLMPYAALAAGFGVLVEVAGSAGGGEVIDFIAGAIGLTVLVLFRQEMVNQENARLLADVARAEAEGRYEALESEASDTFILVGADSIVAYASSSLERVLDVNPAEMIGRPVTRLAHADDVHALGELVADSVAGRPVAPLEWRIWTKDGAWRQVETISSNLLADPTIGKVVLTTRDVGERGALRMQVAQAGLRDVLTGLPNRLLFEDRLTQALAASQRGASAVAVVLLDLDGFSRLNGSFGHHVGDRVLREVARRLSGEIRASDTVARVGGDAFGILIAPGSAAVEALEVAARVRTALREPMSEGPTTFELTASIGIAGSDGSARIDAADLIRNADIAMTLAGNDGTDRLVVFEESMQRDLEGRFELEADLRHAVAAGQLVLQYQPIVDLATRELVGAEALVRWDHPVQGRLAPGLFIPIAEQAGLIEDIGGWVLREACREVAQWARLAPGRVPRVSVNLAAPQLANPQLPWLVKSTLAEAGAAPSWLTLEVTESLLVSDVLEVLGRLHAIRALGVKISVDDFGTGYSSLAYLQQFPVNHIKIDGSFVMPLDDGGNERGLVPAIVEIGRALGMSTIAEGIETERQLQRLIAMGCNLGQGYLFARPLDASAMRDLVRGAMAMPSAA